MWEQQNKYEGVWTSTVILHCTTLLNFVTHNPLQQMSNHKDWAVQRVRADDWQLSEASLTDDSPFNKSYFIMCTTFTMLF